MDIKELNPVVLEILKKRGISSDKEIEEFISDKPQLTYDPFLLPDMKEGVDFILDAINNNERICIYGDYDVDGITATALLYNFLSQMIDNITYYIPSRFEEGYGLNNESLQQLRNDGVDVIITVDCGAVSKSEIDHAKSIGLKVLVTDHHNMEEVSTPDCLVINPKHFNSMYPFKGLCGCAVAFKLLQAIVRTEKMDKANLVRPLDLVAIATIADVMPLVDENRTMVKYGLKELNKGTRKALRIMMNKLELEPGSIDSYKIGFVIGPHMNAAGRMSNADSVVKMLISDNNEEIDKIVDKLIEHNRDRKAVQEKCFDECIEIIEKEYLDVPFLLIRPESVHEGIAGIVAGKIREKYSKPTIIMSLSIDDDGHQVLKGSGRSIVGIDLINMLLKHKDIFDKLGGHAMAAGFTISAENEKELRDFLEHDMTMKLEKNPHLLDKTLDSDAIVLVEEINTGLANDLNLMSPFGVDNPKPVIELDDVSVSGLRFMGNEEQHVKFSSGRFDCILFGAAQENKDILYDGNHVDLFGNLDINSWMGRENVQFLIKAVRSREE